MSYLETNGYIRGYFTPSPVTDKQGRAYQHRVVLYEEIGYGPHLCKIGNCGKLINWGYGLEVDHKDKNRANNTLSNLRPSCLPCNRKDRVRYQVAA